MPAAIVRNVQDIQRGRLLPNGGISAGLPVHDYYLLADGSGNTLKFRIADDMPVWESPAIAERSADYRDGVPWEVYFKNGLTIALTDAIVRDYGKWHRVDVIISNNSLTPVEFNPETDMTAYSVDEHDVATDLQVWSCDSYLKKVTGRRPGPLF